MVIKMFDNGLVTIYFFNIYQIAFRKAVKLKKWAFKSRVLLKCPHVIIIVKIYE